jgi:hypothetical protein
MGFKGNRGPIIILIIAVLVIVGIIALGSSGGRKSNPAGLITCTVNGDVGIDKVIITNQNTGKSITKTYADLPYSFNLTEGDTLRLNVTIADGYAWNAWEINQYPWFAQDNPFTMKISEAVTFNPRCLVK